MPRPPAHDDPHARPAIAVDARVVAAGLGLETAAFRDLMDAGRIATLCERGVGEDAGLYRATFYYGPRRVRLVLDADGRVVGTG